MPQCVQIFICACVKQDPHMQIMMTVQTLCITRGVIRPMGYSKTLSFRFSRALNFRASSKIAILNTLREFLYPQT